MKPVDFKREVEAKKTKDIMSEGRRDQVGC